eukprot:NODE_141_length_17903_cov_0.288643.p11 type:complete len:103 gc:universal NODE_141_length_17903_cov_0.288643:13733-14041(+)
MLLYSTLSTVSSSSVILAGSSDDFLNSAMNTSAGGSCGILHSELSGSAGQTSSFSYSISSSSSIESFSFITSLLLSLLAMLCVSTSLFIRWHPRLKNISHRF